MSLRLKLLLTCSLLILAQHAAPLQIEAQSDCGPNLRCGQVPWQLPVMPILVSPTPFATSVPEVVQPTQQSGYVIEVTPTWCTTPAALTGDYKQQVANTGPASYWPLDETSGTVATDAVGGRNGTYTGATLNGYTWAGGPAPSFDGVNDRAFIGGLNSIMNGGSFTVAFWMRVASSWAGSATLAWFGETGNVFSLARSNGNIVLTSGGSTASASVGASGTSWVHVAAVINRPVMGGQSGRLYINGVNVASTNTAPGTFTASTLFLASNGTASYHAGGIGHAAVWARALGQGEMGLLANASPAGVATPTPHPNCIPGASPEELLGQLDMDGLNGMLTSLQNLPVNQIGVANPQAGFDMYSGTATFFSYVLGIQSVNLGIFTPIIGFIFWSFFSFVAIKVAFILLPIVAGLIGVVRRVVQLVLDFLPL